MSAQILFVWVKNNRMEKGTVNSQRTNCTQWIDVIRPFMSRIVLSYAEEPRGNVTVSNVIDEEAKRQVSCVNSSTVHVTR